MALELSDFQRVEIPLDRFEVPEDFRFKGPTIKASGSPKALRSETQLAEAKPQSSLRGPLPPEALALPAEFGALFGIDARSIFDCAEYKGLRGHARPDAGAPITPIAEVQHGIAEMLKSIEDDTGVNPERDVDRLVIGSAAMETPTAHLVWIALGRFDAAKILKATEDGAGLENVNTKSAHGQTILVVSKAGKPDHATVVIDSRLLVWGKPEIVEATLGSWAQGLRPLATNIALMTLVESLHPESGAWLAVGPSVTQALRRSADPQRLPFPIPKTLKMASRRESFEVTAEMADEAEATKTANLIHSGLTTARTRMTGSNAASLAQAAVLDMYRVTAEGPRVTLSLTAVASDEKVSLQMLAAMLTPSLRRARVSANEVDAIVDTRAVIGAEALTRQLAMVTPVSRVWPTQFHA